VIIAAAVPAVNVRKSGVMSGAGIPRGQLQGSAKAASLPTEFFCSACAQQQLPSPARCWRERSTGLALPVCSVSGSCVLQALALCLWKHAWTRGLRRVPRALQGASCIV
jgi:hypothetical protein